MKASNKRLIVQLFIVILLVILSVSFIYPFFYMAANSLKTRTEYIANPFSLPQSDIRIDNYVAMISNFQILRLFRNTFFVVVPSVFFITITSLLASYAFAKLRFRGKGFLYVVILITILIPPQVTMIPMYVMYSRWGIINKFSSVITAYLGVFGPQVILLMTANLRTVPNVLLEASYIDGCNYFQRMVNIIFPLAIPTVMLVIIFYFIGFWNDLLYPMLFLQKMDVRTIMPALASLLNRYTGDPAFQLSGLLLSTVPAILVYVFFQKYIIKGITMGAIK